MSLLARILYVVHVLCAYRLISLMPSHPARAPLLVLQYLMPSSWFGPRGLSEGERLRAALEKLGPIFIKFGQLLATRRDLLPPEWTDALARLQDQVAPFPVREARARIEAELGVPIDSVFSRFDDTPLASASIAQVHSAALQDSTEVVVKIRRPGLGHIVDRDLAVMRFGATWLERLWADARYFRPAPGGGRLCGDHPRRAGPVRRGTQQRTDAPPVPVQPAAVHPRRSTCSTPHRKCW